MTPLAISKIRSNYATLSRDRDGLAADLSARLGAASRLSTSGARPGPGDEGAAVVALVDRLVRSLERLGGSVSDLEALRPCYDGHHWPITDYMTIGEALLDTLQARLASDFDEDARAAWATAFVLVADIGMAPVQGGVEAATS